MDEHLTELQEKNVGEGQGNAETDVPSYAAPSLLGRKGHAHYSKNECGERKSKPLVLLHERELDIGITPHLLSVYQIVEL